MARRTRGTARMPNPGTRPRCRTRWRARGARTRRRRCPASRRARRRDRGSPSGPPRGRTRRTSRLARSHASRALRVRRRDKEGFEPECRQATADPDSENALDATTVPVFPETQGAPRRREDRPPRAPARYRAHFSRVGREHARRSCGFGSRDRRRRDASRVPRRDVDFRSMFPARSARPSASRGARSRRPRPRGVSRLRATAGDEATAELEPSVVPENQPPGLAVEDPFSSPPDANDTSARLWSNVAPDDSGALTREPGSLPGAIALVAGTTVGAGMLALPTVCQSSGFVPSTTALVLCWGTCSAPGC